MAIVGASGFTGVELLRLCAGHPDLQVVKAVAGNNAGGTVAGLYPSLASAYPDTPLDELDVSELVDLDAVFLALPHGQAQDLVPQLMGKVGLVVDLSADFRLRDRAAYRAWYGHEHSAPELLSHAVYGLAELNRKEIEGADLVAAPGCYPTAAALALSPLVKGGSIEPTGVIVDAASGVSGAGAKLARESHFNTVDEDFRAYGLLSHRHTPEIEQVTGAQVLFTPHLAPMNRGILATCYARPTSGGECSSSEPVMRVLHDAYDDEPFVHVSDTPPSTKATFGSNCAHVSARFDARTGWVVVLCAIDNLVKGASGQALQCANIALGLEETTGLPSVGVYP